MIWLIVILAVVVAGSRFLARGLRRMDRHKRGDGLPEIGPRVCRPAYYGDTTICAKCGLIWDTNDPAPPACKGGNRK